MAILNNANAKNSTVEVKRSFNTTPEKIFNAIREGILFKSCSMKPETVKTDFREGGSYSFTCNEDGAGGKFTKISPHNLIQFKWPDGSDVTITLKADGETTLMHLLHENIASEAAAKDYDSGWRNGINNFSPHFGHTIIVERSFQAPLAKVYPIFAAKEFFAQTNSDVSTGEHEFRIGGKYSFKNSCTEGKFIKGEFTDIKPNRIAFTWIGISPVGPTGETLVVIDFLEKNATTMVKLTHSGFADEANAKAHNGGWTQILDFLSKN